MGSIILIRHGQASFGAADYDRLSPRGEEQSVLLGRWLARTHGKPDRVLAGSMQRHHRTASLCLEAAGVDMAFEVNPGLDELNHVEILRRHRPDLPDETALHAEMRAHPDPHKAFQALFSQAIAAWVGAGSEAAHDETWPKFRERVLDSLKYLAGHAAEITWVFTSGGPIAVMVQSLLQMPEENTFSLAYPLINTSLTTLRTARGAPTFFSYNTAPHLEDAGDAALLTHR
ncbi:histidine phosphatase family protein [Pinirhizobacter sp.]|jgi:broad specificity phosphatase PhoE|uniref:histidine phosphatase family protein n=1 Tax=Pinirhizobacter sp. TaxID=2950432 RepID=UPI002F3EAB37